VVAAVTVADASLAVRIETPAMTVSTLAAARAVLDGARRLAVLTGAGISADSGVPTFRDAQTGLWSRYDPMRLASPEGFAADPPLVWRWYAWRRGLVARAEPNAGHLALAQAEGRFERLRIVTQNVDGLHQRAGSRDVIELHGSIVRTRCFARCGVAFRAGEKLPAGEPPPCPGCGNWLRPDVVWFGEMLDPALLQAAQTACTECDVLLVVGTSGLVHPAAGLPLLARRAGVPVIVVNPQPTELDPLAKLVVRGAAAAVLPPLLARGSPQAS
jgi:NAD-dependent deacetylase